MIDGAPEAPDEPSSEKMSYVDRVTLFDRNIFISSKDEDSALGGGGRIETRNVVTMARVRISERIDC